MNVLNLATTIVGGAGKASSSFNEILNNFGYNSIILTKHDLLSTPQLITRLRKKINNTLTDKHFKKKYCFENRFENKEYVNAGLILKSTPFKPDIIIIHWVSNFINSKTIHDLEIITGAKIVWIMMDNAPLTGGCHYPWECIGYQTDCSNCPAINKISKKHIAANNLSHKKSYLPENIKIIAGSECDYQRALISSLYKKENIYKILFPIDLDTYAPASKNEARNYFNIERSKKVILYGSIDLENVRKGTKYFFEALKYLQDTMLKNSISLDSHLVVFAGNKTKEINNAISEIQIPFVDLGYLNEPDLIKSYQAADVYVSTSLEDSGPLMLNQSISCGTPIVSFNTGVAKDIVLPDITGYISSQKNAIELSDFILKILKQDDQAYSKMALNCRDFAMKNLHHQSFMKSFNSAIL